MAAETWALSGDSRGNAETTLTASGYTVTSHAITPADWDDFKLREIIRICKAAGCQVKYTASSGQGTAETFVITGDARSEVEKTLELQQGLTISSHAISLPTSWTMAQLSEIIRVIKAGGCKLTYTISVT